MRKLLIILFSFLLLLPPEIEGQTRQRANTKSKSGAVTQKNAAKKSSSKNSAVKKSAPKTSSEAKKQQAETQKEIQLTRQQIKENEAKVSKGLSELGKLDVEMDKTRKKVQQLGAQVATLNKEITGLETSVKKNEAELQKLREEYLKAVKKMRVTRKNKSMLAFVFSSKNMSQAMRRMRYLKEFSAWRGRQTEEINGKIADLKQEREALAKAREEQKTALTLQKSSENQLAAQHKQQEIIVAELKQNGKALESHLKQKQAEARELDNMVSQLIAEEQRKSAEEEARKKAEAALQAQKEEEARRKAREALKKNEELAMQEKTSQKEKKGKDTPNKDKASKKDKNANKGAYADARKRDRRGANSGVRETPSSIQGEASGGSDFPDMRGRLPKPSSGSFQITSRFGRQTLADLPGVEYDNPGIDAESDIGASAQAVFKGKVSGVYLLPGYNTVVIVNHGDYYTVYGNLQSPAVKTGDSVDAGTRLGALALNEDDDTHSAIHFEVWRNRDKLNPEEWLKLSR